MHIRHPENSAIISIFLLTTVDSFLASLAWALSHAVRFAEDTRLSTASLVTVILFTGKMTEPHSSYALIGLDYTVHHDYRFLPFFFFSPLHLLSDHPALYGKALVFNISIFLSV